MAASKSRDVAQSIDGKKRQPSETYEEGRKSCWEMLRGEGDQIELIDFDVRTKTKLIDLRFERGRVVRFGKGGRQDCSVDCKFLG